MGAGWSKIPTLLAEFMGVCFGGFWLVGLGSFVVVCLFMVLILCLFCLFDFLF